MDAPCKIQGSIHVFRLVNNMCPGKWVHINFTLAFFISNDPIYVPKKIRTGVFYFQAPNICV